MEVARFTNGDFVVKMSDEEFGKLLLQTAASVILQVHDFEEKPEENFLGWKIEDRILSIESQLALLFDSAEAIYDCEHLITYQLTFITEALSSYQAWKTNYLRDLEDEKVRKHFKHHVFKHLDWTNHNRIIRREI